MHKNREIDPSLKSIPLEDKTEQISPENIVCFAEKKIPTNPKNSLLSKTNLKNSDLVSPSLFLEKPLSYSENTSEMIKKTVQKFIEKLNENSIFKKVPLNLKEIGFGIIGDKSHFNDEIVENKRSFFGTLWIVKMIGKMVDLFFESSKLIIHPYQNFKIFGI